MKDTRWKKQMPFARQCQIGRLAPIIVLALIICLQCVMAVHWGSKKAGYHVDEMFTFELANYPDGFVHRTAGVVNGWQDGEFYQEALTATGERAFQYSIPYHNQEIDVHPPLYYFVIHTASSISGTFSKWVGIVPNLIFLAVSSLLLYAISVRLLRSPFMALVTVALWGLGLGAMSSAVFIRMYAMLTMACLLLVYIHLCAAAKLLDGQICLPQLGILLLSTAFGILTQYYFLIFCLFWCGCWFFALLLKKKWKTLAAYTAAEGLAIVVSVLIFPKMLAHLFSSSRGQEAFKNAADSSTYGEHLKKVASIISKQIANGWIKELLIIAAILIVSYGMYRLYHGRTVQAGDTAGEFRVSFPLPNAVQVCLTPERMILWFIAAASVGYILLVAKIAPYQTDRYYMCVYPLIALVLLSFLSWLFRLLLRRKTSSRVIVAVLSALILVCGYRTQSVNHLYTSWGSREAALSAYMSYPAVVLNNAYNALPDRYMCELANYTASYRCEPKDFSSLSPLKGDPHLTEGFLLYAAGMANLSTEELFESVCEYLPINTYELITDVDDPVYFCTLEVSK